MNKKNLNKLLDDFVKRIEKIAQHYSEQIEDLKEYTGFKESNFLYPSPHVCENCSIKFELERLRSALYAHLHILQYAKELKEKFENLE